MADDADRAFKDAEVLDEGARKYLVPTEPITEK